MTVDHGDREREDRHYADRRDLNRGFSDAMGRAVELALTPAIFGFFGWMIDGWLGTRPLFMIGLGLFTVLYVAWRMMRGYEAEMRQRESELYTQLRGRRS